MITYNDDIARLNALKQNAGQSWAAINPEYIARLRAQNRFKTGLDIARYTAAIMQKDMGGSDIVIDHQRHARPNKYLLEG